ncbi:DUF1934 domain-containing protein [Sporolactobacillus sp. CPB3-1]|uniref:DUF1934 domain-containing protein n=1 Tax=Sporolactobacillus mangiferae TaxID=2940498 RepID=A0ABT0M8V4_9BACL|nr:DUF1934 domain-containing protein [Sporolactobacillus mangiferae]MCL1631291.1 DUF1934 domain-containing protein [Sporolactobacillus mangiferae]
MITRSAEIIFTSKINDDNDSTLVQEMTRHIRGRMGKSGSSLYLIFSTAMGDLGCCDYIIRVGGSEALILRKGPVPMRQPLLVGHARTGTYDAGYAKMETRAVAEKIETRFSEEQGAGSVLLIYQLTMQEQRVGTITHNYCYRVSE